MDKIEQYETAANMFEAFVLQLRLTQLAEKKHFNTAIYLLPRAENYNDKPLIIPFSMLDQDIKTDLIEAIADQLKRQQTRFMTTAAGIRSELQQRARQLDQDKSRDQSRAAYIQKAIDLSLGE